MKGVGGELDPGELLISDDNAHGILAAIELGPHPESSGHFRGSDQAHDGHQAHQQLPAPVHRDVREQAVFDLVPLAGPRREVTDGNGEPSAVRELLQLPFPELDSRSVAAAGVRRDQQRGGVRMSPPTHDSPPPADRLDREAGGVVINPNADPALVAVEVVDPVGNHLALRGNQEVVHTDRFGIALRPPFSARILEVAHQLLLLRVHRDRGLVLLLEAADPIVDVVDLPRFRGRVSDEVSYALATSWEKSTSPVERGSRKLGRARSLRIRAYTRGRGPDPAGAPVNA